MCRSLMNICGTVRRSWARAAIFARAASSRSMAYSTNASPFCRNSLFAASQYEQDCHVKISTRARGTCATSCSDIDYLYYRSLYDTTTSTGLSCTVRWPQFEKSRLVRLRPTQHEVLHRLIRQCVGDRARDALHDLVHQLLFGAVAEPVALSIVGMAHRLQEFAQPDGLDIASGVVGRRIVGRLGDEAAPLERTQHGLQGQRRHRELLRQPLEGPKAAIIVIVVADQQHQHDRQPFARLVTGRTLALAGAQQRGVLVVIGELCAHQHDEPAQVKPDHEDDDDGETGIDGGVVGGAGDEGREQPAAGLPQYARDQTADEGGHEVDFGVGDEDIDEGEGAANQHIRQERRRDLDQHADGLEGDETLHDVRTHHRGCDAECGKDQHGTNQDYAHVIAEAPHEPARTIDTPDVVERVLDLLLLVHDRFEQLRLAARAQHADLHVFHEAHDAQAQLHSVFTEWREEVEQHGGELIVHAEGLEHREAHRQQRYQGEERGVDQAHRAERELSRREVAHQVVQQPRAFHQLAARPRQARKIAPPYPAHIRFAGPIQQWTYHALDLISCRAWHTAPHSDAIQEGCPTPPHGSSIAPPSR